MDPLQATTSILNTENTVLGDSNLGIENETDSTVRSI